MIAETAAQPTPRVSVIMPVYNAGHALRPAVASVLGQTMPDFELIIVDDASTDGSTAFLDEYEDARIRVVRNDANRGPAVSRNRAIQNARAPYVAIADGDDLSAPMRLAAQVRFLDANSDVDLVAGACERFTGHGQSLGVSTPLTSHIGITMALRYGSSLTHSSVTMKRDAALSVGGYRTEWDGVEDFEIYTRLALAGSRLSSLSDVVVAYRVAESGLTHSFPGRATALAKVVRADFRRSHEIPPLSALIRSLRSEPTGLGESPRLRFLKILGRVTLGRCGASRAGRARCAIASVFAGPFAWMALASSGSATSRLRGSIGRSKRSRDGS